MDFKSLTEELKKVSRFLYESEEDEYQKHIEECNKVLNNVGLEYREGGSLVLNPSYYNIPNYAADHYKIGKMSYVHYLLDNYSFKKLVSMAPIMQYNKYKDDFSVQQLTQFADNIKNNVDKITRIINSDKKLKYFQNLQILGSDLVKEFPQLFKSFLFDEEGIMKLYWKDEIPTFIKKIPSVLQYTRTEMLFPDVLYIKGRYYSPAKDCKRFNSVFEP